jgi:hypothetical protein
MQFYFYRIDKAMGAKSSRALAMLLRKEKLGLRKHVLNECID